MTFHEIILATTNNFQTFSWHESSELYEVQIFEKGFQEFSFLVFLKLSKVS